ncbi:MAG: hypothetical protein Q9200_004236 [Gallowayella weberi]
MGDYTRLASMMARHGEVAIFRRFDALNLKRLLYMQAELVHLEVELRKIEEEDKNSTDPARACFAYSVYDLKESAYTDKGRQWKRFREVQEKVQAYSRRWYLGTIAAGATPPSSAEWDGVWDYHIDKLEKIANAISTLLAALLPSISILILYFVTQPASRLITISLFSVFFSLILTTVSAAKRVEVFAATTA